MGNPNIYLYTQEIQAVKTRINKHQNKESLVVLLKHISTICRELLCKGCFIGK